MRTLWSLALSSAILHRRVERLYVRGRSSSCVSSASAWLLYEERLERYKDARSRSMCLRCIRLVMWTGLGQLRAAKDKKCGNSTLSMKEENWQQYYMSENGKASHQGFTHEHPSNSTNHQVEGGGPKQRGANERAICGTQLRRNSGLYTTCEMLGNIKVNKLKGESQADKYLKP